MCVELSHHCILKCNEQPDEINSHPKASAQTDRQVGDDNATEDVPETLKALADKVHDLEGTTVTEEDLKQLKNCSSGRSYHSTLVLR